MALNVEVWHPQIVEVLFKTNPHLQHAFNADELVNNNIVHIPNAGEPSNVSRNRSVFPAPIVNRSDNDIVYVLDEYTSDPRRISDIDKKELSYEKRASVIRDDSGNLFQFVGDDMLYKWAKNIPAASKIVSTGATSAATAPGATSTRKIVTEADIRKAKILLDNQNVPMEDRYMVMTPDALDYLMSDNNLKYAFQQVVDLPEGSIGRLYGFNLLQRSTGVVQSDGGTSGTVKLPDAASATTDDIALLFWQKNMVERALGTITMFDNPGVAEYYGDIISFLIRASGRNRRYDNKGVGLIVLSD